MYMYLHVCVCCLHMTLDWGGITHCGSSIYTFVHFDNCLLCVHVCCVCMYMYALCCVYTSSQIYIILPAHMCVRVPLAPTARADRADPLADIQSSGGILLQETWRCAGQRLTRYTCSCIRTCTSVHMCTCSVYSVTLYAHGTSYSSLINIT